MPRGNGCWRGAERALHTGPGRAGSGLAQRRSDAAAESPTGSRCLVTPPPPYLNPPSLSQYTLYRYPLPLLTTGPSAIHTLIYTVTSPCCHITRIDECITLLSAAARTSATSSGEALRGAGERRERQQAMLWSGGAVPRVCEHVRRCGPESRCPGARARTCAASGGGAAGPDAVMGWRASRGAGRAVGGSRVGGGREGEREKKRGKRARVGGERASGMGGGGGRWCQRRARERGT